MANQEHVDILKQGVKVWNKWRKDNPNTSPDLTGAKLREAKLPSVNLSMAILNKTDLRGTRLIRANIDETDLSYADLTGANLSNAVLRKADLKGAKLDGTFCAETAFIDLDLSAALAIENAYHHSPSVIDVGTLYRSRGAIPAQFLRGCGVPDGFIDQLPSLIEALEPIEFHSCFISYSHKDEDFAERLHSRMRDEHLRVWFAPEDIKGGRKIHEQIEQAIRIYDKLLIVLSENSMSSEWVQTEMYKARQKEIKEKRRVLFPIRLVDFAAIREWKCFDADTGKDLARETREYYIPDFSNWKDHDAFEAEFKKLLRDLKKEELRKWGT